MNPFDYMSPEVLQQMIELGGLEDQQQGLEGHLQGLQRMPQHSTGWGAALHGLGNLGGTIAGGLRLGGIREKQGKGRSAYAQALMDAMDRLKVERQAGPGGGGMSELGDYRMYPGLG